MEEKRAYKYECLSEATGFIDGFRKNSLSNIKRTNENTILVSEGVRKYELADSGVIIVLPNNASVDLQTIPPLLQKELSAAGVCPEWTIGHYLDACFIAKDGARFGKGSLCVGLLEEPNDSFVSIAASIGRALCVTSVIVKEKERTLLIETKG